MKVKSWSIVIGGCLRVVLALCDFKSNQIQANPTKFNQI